MSCDCTKVLSCPGSPFTVTRPALISSSALRREATPARARYAFSRMRMGRYGRAALHHADEVDIPGPDGPAGVARSRRRRRADDPGGRRHARRRLRHARPVRRRRDLRGGHRRGGARDHHEAAADGRGRDRDAACIHARGGRGDHSQAVADAVALLVFVVIGVLTHDASVTAFVRDLLCFELAWFALYRLPFVARWAVGVSAAVAVRALIVGHFSVAFYLVALGFTAAFLVLGRTLVRWRFSS